LSNHFMAAPQRGQWEPGYTMDSPRGSLQIHTFKKLPMIEPKIKKIM